MMIQLRTILRHQKDQRVSRVQKQAPMMKMTPTKVLEPKALMAHMKPVWLQSLLKGRGGEMADQTQKMMWMKKNRKKMAYVNALSLMAALYTRMYLHAMRHIQSLSINQRAAYGNARRFYCTGQAALYTLLHTLTMALHGVQTHAARWGAIQNHL